VRRIFQLRRLFQFIISILSIFLLMSMMLMILPGALAASKFVTASDVNLRSNPSTEASVVKAICPGTAVEVVVHDPAGWSSVKVHGDSGYIRSDLLALRNGAGTLRTTTDGVRVRASADTEAKILKVLDLGAKVEVHKHDPAGWSRVSAGGVTGFIRSDFLTATANFVAGATSIGEAHSAAASTSSPITLMTIDGVRLRSGPSTNHDILRPVKAGTNVTVLEHKPDSWSKVSLGGTTGFIRSDLLAAPGTPLNSSGNTQFLQTTTGVNVRSGPGTGHSIVRQLAEGRNVEILSKSNGWSKVRIGDTTGYIKSTLLATAKTFPLELSDISTVNTLVRGGSVLQVQDVRSGITFSVRVLGGGRHLDVDTLTQADTNAMFRSRGGRWSWEARPVKVTIGSRTFAASMNGMPHSVSAVQGNGINGHFCIHFNGSTSNGGGGPNYVPRMQAAVAQAWATR